MALVPMKMMMRGSRNLILLIFLGPIACKKAPESNSDSMNASHSLGVLSVDSLTYLPPCLKDTKVVLAFVASEKKLYICSAGEWKVAEDLGAKGPQGERGISGQVFSDLSEVWRSVFQKSSSALAFLEIKHSGSQPMSGLPCSLYYSGTGFLVSSSTLLTAAHVLQAREDSSCHSLKLETIRLWFAKDSTGDSGHSSRGPDALGMRVDIQDQGKADIALIEIATQTRAPLPLSTLGFNEANGTLRGAQLGDPVLALGFSGASTFAHLTPGNISGFAKTGPNFLSTLINQKFLLEGVSILAVTSIFGAGASGGPLLQTNGEVLGLLSAGDTASADTEFGYCIELQHLLAFLSKSRVWTNLKNN